MEGEPVPTRVRFGEHARAPLAVDPAEPGDGDGARRHANRARGGQAGDRIVVRGVVGTLRREAAVSLENRWPRVLEDEVDGELFGAALEPERQERRVRGSESPALDPGRERRRANAGETGMAAGEALRFVVALPRDVGDGQVPQVHLSGAPCVLGRLPAGGRECLTEERELHAELVAGRGAQGDGEVPPLASKARMRAVIRREAKRHHAVGEFEPPGGGGRGGVWAGVWTGLWTGVAQNVGQPETRCRRLGRDVAAGGQQQGGGQDDPCATRPQAHRHPTPHAAPLP